MADAEKAFREAVRITAWRWLEHERPPHYMRDAADAIADEAVRLYSLERQAQEEALSQAKARIESLESAIREHRDQRGDDRCWIDDLKLYAKLGDTAGTPISDQALPPPEEMLANCRRFIASRHPPGCDYVSPQREVERLTQERKAAIRALEFLISHCFDLGWPENEQGIEIARGMLTDPSTPSTAQEEQ